MEADIGNPIEFNKDVHENEQHQQPEPDYYQQQPMMMMPPNMYQQPYEQPNGWHIRQHW